MEAAIIVITTTTIGNSLQSRGGEEFAMLIISPKSKTARVSLPVLCRVVANKNVRFGPQSRFRGILGARVQSNISTLGSDCNSYNN